MTGRPATKGQPGALEQLKTLERFAPRVIFPPLLGATLFFLLGSFTHALPKTGLPLLDPVTLTAIAILAAAGTLAAFLASRLSAVTQAFLLGILVLAITDLHIRVVDPIAMGILGMAIGYWKPRALARLIGVVFAVVLVGALFAGRPAAFEPAPEPTSPLNEDLPPLVHIMLDELGADADLTGQGFATWDEAYSRYHVTRESLPEMTEGFYTALQERGYDLEVWRNDYIDVCPDGARCALYHNLHFDNVEGRGLSTLRLAQVAIYGWLRTGKRFEGLLYAIDPMVGASQLSPLTGQAVLERAAARAETLERGQALSLHALVPHYPYILDQTCALKPYEEWLGRMPAFPIDARTRAYEEQLACTVSRIARITRDDIVVVVHGDHGTRFFDIDADTTGRSHRAEQYHQAFSTLFAVRLPGVAPARIDRPASVSSLLDELAAGDFATLPQGDTQSVFVGEDTFEETAFEDWPR